jgi:hypothetical protein
LTRTSQTTGLSKPTDANKIANATLKYVNARNRQRAYDLVVKEFKSSGLTQAALAKRLGKGTDVICRLLARPGNWGLDTFSELLFGISGAVPKHALYYPLEKAAPVVRKPQTTNHTFDIDLIARINPRSTSGDVADLPEYRRRDAA